MQFLGRRVIFPPGIGDRAWSMIFSPHKSVLKNSRFSFPSTSTTVALNDNLVLVVILAIWYGEYGVL